MQTTVSIIVEHRQCPVCHKQVTLTSELIKHLRRHHGYSEDQISKFRLTIKDTQTVADKHRKEKCSGTFLHRYGPETAAEIIAKRKQTCLIKYGATSTLGAKQCREKAKKTCLERYGAENPINSALIQDKIKNSNLRNRGVSSPFSDELVKEKIRKTNISRYGTANPFQSEEIKNKIKQSLISHHGSDSVISFEHIQKKSKQTIRDRIWNHVSNQKNNIVANFKKEDYRGTNIVYSWKCNKCGDIFSGRYDDGIIPICRKCYVLTVSTAHSEINDYLASLGISTILNDRTKISPLELDIFCPDNNIAVEYNGMFWHSESSGKHRNYHRDKTIKCNAVGIKLIHLFEDEWRDKQRIVKSRLRNIFGKNKHRIFARKCEIREIDNKTTVRFLNKYHVQGAGNYCIRYGAYYRNRLVAVMTFCKPRIAMGNKLQQDGKFELSRFCVINNFTVIGIANKILHHFVLNHRPTKIVSYADLRWSEGNLYKKLGFTLSHVSAPNYWYIRNGLRYYRYGFRKSVLSKRLETFDENKTEWENMKDNGFDRIWDCGSMVFVKTYADGVMVDNVVEE